MFVDVVGMQDIFSVVCLCLFVLLEEFIGTQNCYGSCLILDAICRYVLVEYWIGIDKELLNHMTRVCIIWRLKPCRAVGSSQWNAFGSSKSSQYASL